MKTTLIMLLATLLATACVGRQNKNAAQTPQTGVEALAPAPVTPYRIPEIPVMLTNPEDRARWAAEHWWDNFDFADTTRVAQWSAYAEQAFVDYDYQLLANIPLEVSGPSIAGLFTKAAANKAIFQRFAEIAEKYLFDPNSPYRNEELYIAVLNAMLAPASPLDEWERVRPAEQLRLAMKNRVGDRAADFRYTLASGATGTLHGLRATYTLIFFNNPGCPACRETMDQIMRSPTLLPMIESGTLRILALYPDEDIQAWRDYLPNMPERWICAYDATQTVKNDELYDLKAIPTLYLLDAQKRVLLKDVMSIPLIEQTVTNATN